MVISHSKPILLKGPERWEVTEGKIHEKWMDIPKRSVVIRMTREEP